MISSDPRGSDVGSTGARSVYACSFVSSRLQRQLSRGDTPKISRVVDRSQEDFTGPIVHRFWLSTPGDHFGQARTGTNERQPAGSLPKRTSPEIAVSAPSTNTSVESDEPVYPTTTGPLTDGTAEVARVEIDMGVVTGLVRSWRPVKGSGSREKGVLVARYRHRARATEPGPPIRRQDRHSQMANK